MIKAQKTLLVLTTMALSAGLLLSACSATGGNKPAGGGNASQPDAGAVKPKEKVTLDFWAHWGSTTRRPIIEKLISDFNASQDRIFVKYTFVPFGDGWTKELAAVAAGNPPDVIIQDLVTVGQRAQKKQATNLAQFVKKDNIQDRFFPQLWDAVTYNNEPYGLPFNTDTRFLFYSKPAFKEVGLDPEKPPKTWDELQQYAQKLDKKSPDGKYQRIGYHAVNAGGWDLWLQNSDGKPLIDKEGPHYNTPQKVEALNWVKSWDDRLGKKEMDAFKATFGSKQNDPFVAGKLAMTVQNGTYYAQIKDFMKPEDIGMAPMPEFRPGTGNWSVGGGFDLEIPYGAKHPQESYEFMKYLTDTAAQKYWAQYLFDNVASKAAANDAEVLKDPAMKFAADNMKWTLVSPVPPSAPDYKNLANPLVEAVLAGKDDAKSALDKAQAAVENLMKTNK
ncbi:ABC transporter substrate-binding protein [Gordoniibacillus kamchatkensis]|uniref:ABC transporter substrate-binding protein n=1 Tax=Gordoniibacillus kamchatkensis TaxID=1590651 RepID=A0ABR5ABF4_9BACL|nr:ABC transporter substrate-binding protein [Paenibacillus sp. VKM B-2647]KIL38359.1 ABC transporter substrate-binding protein [Paenibacillus sp. VKM B-2647]